MDVNLVFRCKTRLFFYDLIINKNKFHLKLFHKTLLGRLDNNAESKIV